MPDSSPDKKQVIFYPGLILALLYYLPGLIPIQSLWGINHLQYFSPLIKIGFGMLLIVSCFPITTEMAFKIFDKLAAIFNRTSRSCRLVMIVAISISIFYLLRVHIHSLGDGYQRAYQIGKGYYFYHTELLDFLFHALFFRFINIFSVVSPEITYSIFSMICGIFFIITVWTFKFSDSWDSKASGLIKILIIAMGGTQLFFGYVESYSLYYPAVIIYILWSVRYLEIGRGIIPISVLMTAIPFIHLTGLFLLPSFLYILYNHYQRNRSSIGIIRHLPAAIVTIGLISILSIVLWTEWRLAKFTGSWSKSFLPLFFLSEYSILSPRHPLDILNELLLIVPASAILLWFIIRGRWKGACPRSLKHYLILIILGGILLLLMVEPKLGMARDWDLFSVPSAALGTAIILLFYKLYPNSNRICKLLIIPVILISSLWVLTNSSPDRQLARAENLLKIDNHGQPYVTELLAHYYLNIANNSSKTLSLYETIPDQYKNARVYSAMAKIRLDLDQPLEALKEARRGLVVDSLEPLLNYAVGAALLGLDSLAQSIPYLMRAQEIMPDDPSILNMLAMAFMNTGRYEQASTCLNLILKNNPGFAPAYMNLGELHYRTGQLDSAYIILNKGLHLEPKNSRGWELLDKVKNAAARQKNP
jgi:tetratricopeptide (TPR) repeat protein